MSSEHRFAEADRRTLLAGAVGLVGGAVSAAIVAIVALVASEVLDRLPFSPSK